MEKEKKLSENKAREIFKGILKGVCYLHEHCKKKKKFNIILMYRNKEIMHRDLKPENILFREGTLTE